MPPTPSMTLRPNCGSRTSPAISSRFPATIGATSSETAPSSGWAAASSSAAAARTASRVAEAQPHQPPLGLVGDRLAAQLDDDRVAERVGGGDRGLGVVHLTLVDDGHAVGAQQRLRVGFGQRGTRGGHGGPR